MINRIAVIGAGPAGCSFCSEIDSNKYDVYLIDSKSYPRTEGREGILAERAIDFLQNLNPPEDIFSTPKEIKIGYVNLETGSNNLQKTIFLNINRLKFDSWLIERIKNKVTFLPETEFLRYSEYVGGISVHLRKKEKEESFTADFLIGAEGFRSSVRKEFAKPLKVYHTIQKRVRTKNTPKYAYFLYHNGITDYCSWIIPKTDHLAVGSALDDVLNRPEQNKRFQLLESKLRDIFGIEITAYLETHSYYLSQPHGPEDFVLGKNNRILLIGEAAGLISASSGEGIGPALYSGQKAARAINHGINILDYYRKHCSDLIDELTLKTEKRREINKDLASLFRNKILERK